MTRKASNVVTMPDSAASTQNAPDARITWNKRFGDESLTLRTSTVEELMELRDHLAQHMPGIAVVANPDRSYFSDGDSCPKDGCKGKLKLRTGSRGNFYGCELYPRCNFTARA